MHSDTVDISASPRKRIVSRAMSEEESLRHIIENMFQHGVNPVRKARSKKSWFAKVGVEEPKCPAQSPDLNPTYGMNWNINCTPDLLTPTSAPDLTDDPLAAEESPKRLSRRDSRYGSLRRGDTRGSQSEDDPAENTSTMELQQNYEMCLAELQSVELRQGVLLFQVECLQDALEGAEEMLIETKREAHQISMELERERGHRRKLENDVALLMQEIERLKEEKISVATESIIQEQKESDVMTDKPAADGVDGCVSEEIKSVDTPSQPTGSTNSFATFAAAAYLLFKNRRLEPNFSKQPASEGTSVDQEVKPDVVGSEQTTTDGSSLKSHDAEDYDESSGYEDAPSDFSPSTPDGSSDAVLPEDGEIEMKNSNEARNAKDPEACLLS